ncbi:hypothetical protein GALL_469530 [mine drainage metagenome]|uniref:Uncharacterized protein n=1 Tax=mine drainage metagenome TaxID=410659 RepID=A0A1J5Q662_9ZZZZ
MSDLLGRAHRGEGAARLLQGEQAQRVAHQGRHAPVLASETVEEEHERKQAQERLGLATAGREVQQRHGAGMLGNLGRVEAVKLRDSRGEGRNGRQDEGDLE